MGICFSIPTYRKIKMKQSILFFILLCQLHCGEKSPAKDQNIKNKPFAFEWLNLVQDTKIVGTLSWVKPPGVGMAHENILLLTFKRKEPLAKTLEVKELKIWPYMKIHGHGGARKTIITEIPAANPLELSYQISGFRFTMSGPWEIEVRAVIDGYNYALSMAVDVP